MMAIVPLALLFATLIPWRRLDRPALIATALAGLAAGVLGILYYDVTRPTSITQTNAISGITHTAPLAANADLRILTGLLAASVVGVTLAWLIVVVRDWRHHQAS
jgi:hypothetical protein